MALDFWIDIEDSAGQRQGSGPITSASVWRYTARMDKAGAFEFTMPASDPKATVVQRKRIARAYAQLDGQRIEVGAGIIDRIQKQPQPDGTVILQVSGDDLVRELTYRSVLNLKLYTGGNPVSHAASVAAIETFAPAGWTFTPDGAPPNDSVYGYFNGETVLAGVVKVADKSQNHFYRGSGRSLIFASSFTPSGVRAIQARGDLSAQTCAITALTEQIDTYDLITRIYPRGSGNADVQLTLRATTRSAPSGFTLNAAQNYIENDAATATYGRIERQIDFRDIGPVENTNADIQSAANMLFDAALETLRRQSTELEQATYTVQIAGCSQLLRPMQSIRVVYRDTAAGLNVNADLNILEATWQVDPSGLYTTDLVVSNADRWPQTDVGTLVDSIAEGRIYQALPQLNANSYVTAYNKLVDQTETAAFRFRFGNEVTQLQQVLFEFQLLPLESSVKAVGGASSGSGDIPTSGPSTDTTSSGGNNETGSGGPTATGDGGTLATESGGPLLTGAGGGTQTGAASGNTAGSGTLTTSTVGPVDTGLGGGGDTIATGSGSTGTGGSGDTDGTSLNTAGTSLNTDSGGSGDTGGTGLTTNVPGTNETGAPQGGDVISSGRHNHGLGIEGGTFGSGWYSLYYDEGANKIKANGLGYNPGVLTTNSGDHTHNLGSHTHTLSDHTHAVLSHTHSVSGHTHSVSSHTHSVGTHTHSLGSHTHSIGSHTHLLASHTHTLSEHAHFLNNHTHVVESHTHSLSTHTHLIAPHTHAIATHTHSMSQHTHSLNNHTHDLSDSIAAIYGIFRESGANTFALSDLEYRVNGGSWAGLETSVDAGDGWRQLDITAQVQNLTTFRPNQANNLLEIRRKSSGATGKTAQIDAQLSVRNVIQAVAYA